MLVAIIGGRSEDEQHLSRIAAKSGHDFQFYRPQPAEHGVKLETALSALGAHVASIREDERPQALVFEALDRPDLAIFAL